MNDYKYKDFNELWRVIVPAMWNANDKNEHKTSGELGIPHSTFRYWVKTWEEKGPPEDVAGELTEQVFSFVDHASRIRMRLCVSWRN